MRYGKLQSLTNGGLTTTARRGSRSSSTTPSCRRRRSAAWARRCCCPGPRRSTCRTSACAAGTRSAAVEHQLDRSRDGVPRLDPGPDAAREHHARRHVVRRAEPDLVRALPGLQLDASTSRFYEGWRTYHSIQFSLNRRFRDGLQFGFNDTIQLYDVHRVAPRFEHTRTARSSAAPMRPRRRSCSAKFRQSRRRRTS